MSTHLRNGRFYLVEGAGHALHWEIPDRLLAALERCRSELPAAAPEAVAAVPAPGRTI
jgi:hypothetical protein